MDSPLEEETAPPAPPSAALGQWPGMDEAVLAFVGAGRWTVLGHRLRPLTMLHRELLRIIGHGVVTGGAVNMIELDLAARLCAQDAFAAGRWLGAAPSRLGRWWQGLRGVWLLLRWGRCLERERETMAAYLAGNATVPEMMHKVRTGDEAAQPTDAPPLLALLSELTAAGYPYREVLGVWPCGLVEWVFQTVACKESGSKFITEKDKAIMTEIERLQSMAEPSANAGDAAERGRSMMRRMRGQL